MTKILYAEDNSGDVVLIKNAFAEYGREYEFLIAKDGEIAMQMLDAGCMADLLFLDLNLPKIDGLALLQNIKLDARFEHLPVFIFTSSKASADVRACTALGAAHYFIKPKLLSEYRQLAAQIIKYLEN